MHSNVAGIHQKFQMGGDLNTVRKQVYYCDQCSYTSAWPSNLKRHKHVRGEREREKEGGGEGREGGREREGGRGREGRGGGGREAGVLLRSV